MKFTIVHILLLLLALLVYQCSHAQDHVVSLKGDTLRGEVKPLTYGPQKRVQVVSDTDGKRSLGILEVREFVYNGETYRPVRFNDTYVFMKLIRPGYLSMYAFQLEGQQTWDGVFLQKRDGKSLEVPNLSFKKLMSRFLDDCQEVAGWVNSGELGKRDLDAIVDAYNGCIQNRTVDHTLIVETRKEAMIKSSSWDKLHEVVKSQPDFEGKADALEMIADIKGKVMRGEKVPNFLIQGLKETLGAAEAVRDELDAAIAEL